MMSFDIVPNAEADRVIARYRKKGFEAEVYSKELIVTIAKKKILKKVCIYKKLYYICTIQINQI